MIDRQKLEIVLARRFPGAQPGQIAAAANAIMGLREEPDMLVPENRQALIKQLKRSAAKSESLSRRQPAR